MRLVLQRVARASVTINGGIRRETGAGLVILMGVCPGDTPEIAAFMAEKAANLRIFSDENGAMNLSLIDTAGSVLVISNFTLYANSRKGRRPSFTGAAPPSLAEPLYNQFARDLAAAGITDVKTGEFGADMEVEIINNGPVTIILDSNEIMPQSRPTGGL